jgi:dienelactone hydrolase
LVTYARTAVTLGLALVTLAGCGAVSFPPADPDVHLKITGALRKPEGAGPFPAVVLMHGCDGVQSGNQWWVDDLTKWGYVTLMVDSFGPRGLTEICTNLTRLSPSERTADAYGALAYLRTLPFVDKDRVAIMGWSHGAMVVLSTLWEHRKPDTGGFRAGVAMYPWCEPYQLYAPTLILVGGADDWTPGTLCNVFKNNPKAEVKIYPGAVHSFDDPGRPHVYLGHVIAYDSAATADARQRVRDFLGRQMRP